MKVSACRIKTQMSKMQMWKAMCLFAVAFASATVLAEDLTVSADQTLTLSAEAVYGNLILENGAKLTVTHVAGANAQTLKITGAISGSGTIELDSARVAVAADVPDTIRWEITGSNISTNSDSSLNLTKENRIVGTVSGTTIKVSGPLVGSGRVRIVGGSAFGVGGIGLNGDNSAFEGTLVIAPGSYNKFTSSNAGSTKMTLLYEGYSSNDGSVELGVDGTIKFGSVQTLSRTTENYPWRFNTYNYTMEIGHLNCDDDRISVKIGEANNNATGHVRIRKVGTGTLELWNPNHRRGIDIDNGTVLLTSDGALSVGNADITFGSVDAEDAPGGTLKYGINMWNDNGTEREAPIAVTTDYSAQIKNSLAPISINTGTNEITFATALAASNVGGLVKKGEGMLTLSVQPLYTGKTIVESGHLKTVVNTAPDSTGFEVKSGAEITFTTTASGFTDTGALGGTLADDATVNLDRTGNGLWRFQSYPAVRDGFKGTVNFVNTSVTRADGLVWGNSTVGNSNVVWGVLGTPSVPNTRLFDIESQNGATVYLGALRQTGENGLIYVRYRNTIEIGGRSDAESVLNGKLCFGSASSSISKIGSGKMTLGSGFGIVANDDIVTGGSLAGGATTNYPTLNITAGTFENNADLSAFTVNLADGVSLSGSGTWPAGMTMPSSYKVPVAFGETTLLTGIDVDFASGAELEFAAYDPSTLDKTKTYSLLTAKSISGASKALTEVLDTLNGAGRSGVWTASFVHNGNGTVTLVLHYQPSGFRLIFR